MVLKLGVPKNAGKFLSSCTTGGFSRRAQLHEVSFSITYVIDEMLLKKRAITFCRMLATTLKEIKNWPIRFWT
jgi:hypothetical protein